MAEHPTAQDCSHSGKEHSVEEIDQQLLELLSRRVQLMRARYREKPASILDMQHEVSQLAADHAQGLGLSTALATTWLRHAASICAREVATLREPIVFLGPIYSYSYLAAVKHFGLAAELVPVTSIAAAFEEIVRGQARFGVVPIENSTDGRIVDTLGMFARSPVQICGEVLLPVHHCLLGMVGRANVREVHSKPQAISQCRNWLAQHVPDAKLVEVSSTAAAAAAAAETPGVAAIASAEAGIHHGLQIIDENIEDNRQNVTRFAVIGNRETQPSGADKTSLMFQLKHQPGALADAMHVFQRAGVNLTWIESFPLPNCPNEYLFFVELEGHKLEAAAGQAIEHLRTQAVRLEVLGSYALAISPEGSRPTASIRR